MPLADALTSIPAFVTGSGWPARLARLGIATVAGLLLVVSMPPHDLWPLAWLAVVLLVWLAASVPTFSAAGYGLVCGAVTNIVGSGWVMALVERYGGLSPTWSLVTLVLFSLYQATRFALWALVISFVAKRRRTLIPLAAGLGLVVAEYAIPLLFPWTLAMTQYRVWPLVQAAELGGPLATSFLLAVGAAGLLALAQRRWRAAAVGLGLLVVIGGGGSIRGAQVLSQQREALAAKKSIRIGVLQPNFGIVTKADRAKQGRALVRKLRRDSQALERMGAELILWPESAWPYPIDRRLTRDYPPGHPWRLRLGLERAALVVGSLTYDFKTAKLYNSAMLYGPQGRRLGRYDKVYLLAFGEYVPLADRFPKWADRVRKRMPYASEINAGKGLTVLPLGRAKLLPLICYEDLMGAFTRRAAGSEANVLVNLTNDAWFGVGAAPHQHVALSVFRAVELRRQLVRATGTGVSAHIDATGRILKRTRLVRGGLDQPSERFVARVALLEGRSLYAAVGDLFAWLCVGFLGLLLLVCVRLPEGRASNDEPEEPDAPEKPDDEEAPDDEATPDDDASEKPAEPEEPAP